MSVNLLQLKSLAGETIVRLRAMTEDEVRAQFVMEDYHGFGKARFSQVFLSEVAGSLGLNAEEIQLEIVQVKNDLTSEIHFHRESSAVIVCLGEEEYFPNPNLAQAFLVDHWFDVKAGDVVEIPATTPHGFTVKDGGGLFFLSVQSPWIVRPDGEDDYTRVEI